MIRVFESYKSYTEWIRKHPGGYVLNIVGGRGCPVLHGASCYTVKCNYPATIPGCDAGDFRMESPKLCATRQDDFACMEAIPCRKCLKTGRIGETHVLWKEYGG